jgi:hypothetical protein
MKSVVLTKAAQHGVAVERDVARVAPRYFIGECMRAGVGSFDMMACGAARRMNRALADRR